jgi:hypothetical protein
LEKESFLMLFAGSSYFLISYFETSKKNMLSYVLLTTLFSSTINSRGGKSRFLPFYYSYSKPLREVRCFPEILQSPMRKRCFWNIIAFLRTCMHGASFLFSIGYYYDSTTRRTRCHWMMGGVSFGVSLLPREKKHHVLPLFLGKIITSVS